jgi:hypothetical protein
MGLLALIGLVGLIIYLYNSIEDNPGSSDSSISSGNSSNSALSAQERRLEYKRRGKSPSGVIDGVYNDMYRENGRPYSDVGRDWDADA